MHARTHEPALEVLLFQRPLGIWQCVRVAEVSVSSVTAVAGAHGPQPWLWSEWPWSASCPRHSSRPLLTHAATVDRSDLPANVCACCCSPAKGSTSAVVLITADVFTALFPFPLLPQLSAAFYTVFSLSSLPSFSALRPYGLSLFGN